MGKIGPERFKLPEDKGQIAMVEEGIWENQGGIRLAKII